MAVSRVLVHGAHSTARDAVACFFGGIRFERERQRRAELAAREAFDASMSRNQAKLERLFDAAQARRTADLMSASPKKRPKEKREE